MSDRQKIIEAAEYLASFDEDRAGYQNGVGFNKTDTNWMHNTLEMPIIPNSVVYKMYHRLLKYHKQVDVRNLTPPEPNNENVPKSWNETKLTFGKHKGKTIAEVIADDGYDYFQFIVRKFDEGFWKSIAKKVIDGKPIDTDSVQNESFIQLDIKSGNIIIKSSIDYKGRIKELSFRNWNPEKKQWECPTTIMEEVIEQFPEAQYSKAFQELVAKQQLLKNKSDKLEPTRKLDIPVNGTLMPFQEAGVEFIEDSGGRCLIGDEMGTGKTIQSLAYLQLHPELRPAVIVCPASVKYNWEDEAKKWLTTDDKVAVLDSSSKFTDADIVVLNYDILKKFHKKLNPEVLILDESHMIKNKEAQRSKLATQLAQKSPRTILLTGTPILNRPVELYNQLHAVNPNLFPENGFMPYAIKYCGAERHDYGWDFSGATNLEELNQLLKGTMIRRTKEQVLTQLPPKRRTSVELEMDNRSKYEDRHEAFKRWLNENKGVLEPDNVLAEIEYLKQMAMEGKIESVKSWLADFIETGEKIVVFANHKQALDEIEHEFDSVCVRVDGSTSQKARFDRMKRFQEDSNIKIFLGNIKAAGTGITLTSASNVAFIELDWTPGIHDQAEDRCHRHGQEDSVNCWYLLARDSIDETMMAMLERKRQIAESVMGDEKQIDFKLIRELME